MSTTAGDDRPQIRILFLADTHLGIDSPRKPRIVRRRRGPDFFDNYLRALREGIDRHADLIVHGGDLFYRSRIPQSLVTEAFRPLLEAAGAGIPVCLVPGNHERSNIPLSLFELHDRILILNRPRTYPLTINNIRVALSGFPFCRQDIRARFPGLVEQTGWRHHDAQLRLLCVHQAFDGAQVGVQDFTFRNSADVIRSADIPAGFDAILSGHIHRSQVLTQDLQGHCLPAPVLYAGAIERTSFAERLEQKGYMMLRWRRTKAGPTGEHRLGLSYDFHQLPTRPMVDMAFTAHELQSRGAEALLSERLSRLDPNSIVRLTVTGELNAEGAHLLRLENLRALAPASMNIDYRGINKPMPAPA